MDQHKLFSRCRYSIEPSIFAVEAAEYNIDINGKRILTVPDRIGHQNITSIRSYGGGFKEYYVARNPSVGM